MQGLSSGNYTFQVRPIDAAGNVGTATTPYAFPVDASLPLPGASQASWLLGWHLYAVIGAAAALVLILAATAACMWLSARQRRRRCEAAILAGGPIGTAYQPRYEPYDPALAAALAQSAAEQRGPLPLQQGQREDVALRAGLDASLEVRLICPGMLHSCRGKIGTEATLHTCACNIMTSASCSLLMSEQVFHSTWCLTIACTLGWAPSH